MSARDVLELATLGSARCLGRERTTASSGRARAATSPSGRSKASRSPARWTDPVEAWLRCGPVSTRHTVIAGKPVVRDGELRLPQLDECCAASTISREWQASVS